MHGLSAAVLAPETLEVGIQRAITKALASGQPYLTFPVGHAAQVSAAVAEMELGEHRFCCLAEPTVFADERGRVTLCLADPDKPHHCWPKVLGRYIRTDHMSLVRSPLVSAYLESLEAEGVTPESAAYVPRLMR